MTEHTGTEMTANVKVEPGLEEFAGQIADQVESFLVALRAIAAEGDGARAVSLLLLEVSQVLLAGARLGAHQDFQPRTDYQPDVGPEVDVDELRMRLADMFGGADTYGFAFDPYVAELVESQLSDDLASIATDLENGLRHYRLGNLEEALWWWQFSYVASWGNSASATLRALQSIVAHDRLDADFTGDDDQVAAANEMLGESTGSRR
jgi:hypothetical protein